SIEYSGVPRQETWRLGVIEIMESTMTEFEENVSFDIDDPDFAPSNLRAIPNSSATYRTVQFSDITFGVNKCEYVHFAGMGTVT
ncbi:unnamed protein product, partial [Heterotrigona itama]